MSKRSHKLARAAAALAVATALLLAGCGSAGNGTTTNSTDNEVITIEWLQGSGVDANLKTAESLAAAFMAENDDIIIEIDPSGPGGTEWDNMVKTRLATGEMTDLLWYNSGSLLQSLNPPADPVGHLR